MCVFGVSCVCLVHVCVCVSSDSLVLHRPLKEDLVVNILKLHSQSRDHPLPPLPSPHVMLLSVLSHENENAVGGLGLPSNQVHL